MISWTKIRRLPLFPIVPFVPLAYIVGSLYALVIINRRVRHVERFTQTWLAPHRAKQGLPPSPPLASLD